MNNIIKIDVNVLNALINKLSTLPYREVSELIASVIKNTDELNKQEIKNG